MSGFDHFGDDSEPFGSRRRRNLDPLQSFFLFWATSPTQELESPGSGVGKRRAGDEQSSTRREKIENGGRSSTGNVELGFSHLGAGVPCRLYTMLVIIMMMLW